jgi:hypothetical protein
VGIAYHVGAAGAAFIPMGIAALAEGAGWSLARSLASVAAIALVTLALLAARPPSRLPAVPAPIA